MQRAILASLLIVVFSLATTAQEMSTMNSLSKLNEIKSKAKSATTAMTPSTPIEHPVDENEYIMGPGDKLRIVIGNREESTFDNLVVTPEGKFLVPSVGSVTIAGITLAEAKAKIREKIKTQYLDDSIEIILTDLRLFKVSVTGTVRTPGMVTVTAMDRVSDAINLADGFRYPQPNLVPEETTGQENKIQQAKGQNTPNQQVLPMDLPEEDGLPEVPARRNIEIIRRGNITLHADYTKFILTGNLDANPKLLDGDVIFVPSRQQMNLGEISIDGAVRNPVTYEYALGDRVSDLLKMASGFSVDADSSQIELIRFTSEGSSTEKIYLLMDTPERKTESLTFLLKPDDRLFVQHIPQFHRKQMLEIRGEVMYPNIYPLTGSIRLKDAIKMAGGFTNQAFLENAYIIRNATKDESDPEFERLKSIPVADMTPMERDYFKVKSRERSGKMSINFVDLFQNNDETQNVLLRDRDLIYIPTKKFTVNVSGQVINPGLIPYGENKKLEDYVKEAGGYNYNAKKSKVRIIRARTGEWVKPNEERIEIGDVIFVPEKRDIEWWQLTMDIAQVAYQLATIYLVIQRTQ